MIWAKQNSKILIYQIILFGSLLLFLLKGIQYAFLGSYSTLLTSIIIIAIFYLIREKKNRLNSSIKIWAILIIAWSLIRIFFGILIHFVEPLTENHLQENLGFLGMCISIFFLFGGFFLINKKNRNNWLQQRV